MLTGHVARRQELQREGNGRWGKSGATRGRQREQEVARGRPTATGGARQRRRRGAEEGKQEVEEDEDLFAISENSRDQIVNWQ